MTMMHNLSALSMHVIPEADLGIIVLGFGASGMYSYFVYFNVLMVFSAYVSADAALTLDFNVDTSAASISVDASVDFAGVRGECLISKCCLSFCVPGCLSNGKDNED